MLKAVVALAASVLIAGAHPLAAQRAAPQRQAPAMRTIEVPANASWQHAETSLILPSRLADLRRVSIRDLGRDELDIVVSYEAADGTVATIYLFKSGFANPSIWFDRALFALQHTRRGQIGPAAPAITGFTPSGRSTGGLLTAVDLAAPAGGSTALAVIPAATGFLLKVRITSSGRAGARLRADLVSLLGGVRWPQWAREPGIAAAAIQPCAQPLRTRRAREVRGDLMSGMLNALIGAVPASVPAGGTYCREAGATPVRGVYRLNAATNAYVVALGDSGLALSAGPTLTIGGPRDGQPNGSQASVIFHDREGTALLPTYDRLPPPDQAVRALTNGGPTMRIETRR